ETIRGWRPGVSGTRRPGLEGSRRLSIRSSQRLSGIGSRWIAYPGAGATGRTQRPPQRVLDLGVHAAQVVGGPPGDALVDVRVEAQQQALALRHDFRSIPSRTACRY